MSRNRRGGAAFGDAFLYVASSLLPAALAVFFVPAVTSVAGAEVFGFVAAGQAIGAVGGIILAWGYSVSGPARVATSDAAGLRVMYWESIRLRLALTPILVFSVAVFCLLLYPDMAMVAVLGAIGTVLQGWSSDWVFVGLGRPRAMLMVSIGPRVAVGILGLLLMVGTKDVLVGLVVQSAALVFAAFMTHLYLVRTESLYAVPTQMPFEIGARERHGVVGLSVCASALSLPLIAVSILAPSALPSFALADKMRSLANTASQPAILTLQGHFSRPGAPVAHRAKAALRWAILLAAVGAAFLIACFDDIARFLSAGDVPELGSLGSLASVLIGLVFLDQAVHRVVLPILGAAHQIERNAILGITLVIALVGPGVLFFGSIGAILSSIVGVSARVTRGLLVSRHRLRGSENGS